LRLAGAHLTRSEEETATLARALGASLPEGSWVLLDGPLGAGKTAFVRGLAEGLGVDPRLVHSPTFTLVSEYAGGRGLVHVDLYRIGEPGELDELGLQDLRDSPVVVAVEWADKLPAGLATGGCRVRIQVISESERRIVIGDVQMSAQSIP